MMLIYDDNDDK